VCHHSAEREQQDDGQRPEQRRHAAEPLYLRAAASDRARRMVDAAVRALGVSMSLPAACSRPAVCLSSRHRAYRPLRQGREEAESKAQICSLVKILQGTPTAGGQSPHLGDSRMPEQQPVMAATAESAEVLAVAPVERGWTSPAYYALAEATDGSRWRHSACFPDDPDAAGGWHGPPSRRYAPARRSGRTYGARPSRAKASEA
jgi:hypothetical protein